MFFLLSIFLIKEPIDILPEKRTDELQRDLTLQDLYSSQLIVSFPSGLWLVHWRSTSSFTYLGISNHTCFSTLLLIPLCYSIWDLWSNLVWVNLIHLASSSWLTIPSAFSSILFQMVHFRILELGINLHQGDIITCPRWPPISFDSPQDWVHQTPPPGPRQGTPRGHSHGRGRRDAGWNQVEVVQVCP